MKTHYCRVFFSNLLIVAYLSIFAQEVEIGNINSLSSENYPDSNSVDAHYVNNSSKISEFDLKQKNFNYSTLKNSKISVKSNSDDNVIYDNGPLITHPGAGYGGLDASALQESIGLTVHGWNANRSQGYSLSDDFIVDDFWILNNIELYVFQVNATNATIIEASAQIWDGDPNLPESTVIFGDLSTNRLLLNSLSDIYRVFESDLISQSRRLQVVSIDLSGCAVTPGIYWIQVQLVGSDSYSGPWVPPITIWGQQVTGNALQYTNDWTSFHMVWSGSPPSNIFPQGLPFVIKGFQAECPEPTDLSTELISQTSTRIQWYENDSSNSWEIEYGPTSFIQGSGTLITYNCDTICNYYYDIDDLLPGISYDWYIRAICDSVNYSEWSGPETFETVSNFLNLKTFLEGPFFYGQMSSFLNFLGYIPLAQPYNISPWYYLGDELVELIPNDSIIDWVLVNILQQQIVNEDTNFLLVGRKAAFIKKDGLIIGSDGSSPMEFPGINLQDSYVKIIHRNHLPIISSTPLMQTSGVYDYDFTDNSSKTLGGIHSVDELQPNVWGMIAGNGFYDSQINNLDKDSTWIHQIGNMGYYNSDYNLDSQVDLIDKMYFWEPNSGKGIRVSVISP